MKSKKLNETDRSNLKNQLKIDSEKAFNSEFIRTTNLEFHLINEYGFEGIQLIFEDKNSKNYFLLGDFPKDCPWTHCNEKPIEEVIETNFEQIKNKIPNLISELKERCKFIYTEQKGAEWHLHYLMDMKLFDERDYFIIYSGGAPLPEPKVNENLSTYNWTLPKDLKEFYTIHNGFGQSDGTNFILSNEQLEVMAKLMDPICEEQNTRPNGYSFDNLLEFCPDGGGNAQCFFRTKAGNNVTVDWDHETWEISEEEDFYPFIDERMSEIDEE